MSHRSFLLAVPALTLALLPLAPLTAATPPQAAQPVAAAAASVARPAAALAPITHDVYATWRSIQHTQLSRDGQWIAYALVAQEADGELVVRHLADGREYRAPRGTSPQFSADGRFVAFAVQPTRAELDKAKKDKKKPEDGPKAGAGWMDLASGQVQRVERVKRFAWGKDGGQHLALLLEPPAKKGGGTDAAKDGKAPGTELVLVDAATNQRNTYKDVAEFEWNRPGTLLAYTLSVKEAPKKDAAKPASPPAPAAAASSPTTAASPPAPASAAVPAPGASDPAVTVAATAAADAKPASDETAREGVYVVDPAEPTRARAVMSGGGSYKQLAFDEAGRQLAFVSNRDHVAKTKAEKAAKADKAKADAAGKDDRSDKDEKDDKAAKPDPTPYQLFLWKAGQERASMLVGADTAGMPAGWTPSEHASLAFSKDGRRLFLGTAELPAPEPKDAPEPVKVDLWHWKDPELQSAQKANAKKDRERSYRAVVHLGADADAARFVQLATKEMPTVQVNENAGVALGLSELPYRQLMSWEGLYMDAYAVDLNTGKATPLARKLRHAPTLSPAGRYVLGFDAPSARWMAWRTDTAAAIDLTGRIKSRFDNDDRDVPDLPSPYGSAGWTADDDSVVLYDKFDLWAVQPASGQARPLTQGWGRRQQVQLRAVPLDPEDGDKKPLPADALTLTGTHDLTRASGYYRVDAAGGMPTTLIQDDRMIGGLLKAKDADRVVFTQQTFTEFPDLWTTTLAFRSPARVSDANPQQARFAWGTQELIEYTAADGKKLRALLAKPADFDPKKQYPLMVYIYEKMTDNRYRYVPPAPSQNINVTRYVSNGYLVLRPDIVYTTGHPGRSAMNTVLPAIRQQVAKGFVDPKRIGIQGHSWGAYQINYLITHTTLFRAAEAGASMANMVSGYGGIRWGAGISRAFQYEHGQSRIGATPWERPDLYLENSPIFRVDKVTTPYLTIHNDEDDAVPWYQGIEFFTALRRLGKEAYWFNYNGEKHGLRDRDNTKHYTVHMAEFFDHYLLDRPRPEWMDQPVPYLERGKRDVMGQFKPVTPPAETAVAKGQEAPAGGSAK